MAVRDGGAKPKFVLPNGGIVYPRHQLRMDVEIRSSFRCLFYCRKSEQVSLLSLVLFFRQVRARVIYGIRVIPCFSLASFTVPHRKREAGTNIAPQFFCKAEAYARIFLFARETELISALPGLSNI